MVVTLLQDSQNIMVKVVSTYFYRWFSVVFDESFWCQFIIL